MILRQHLLHSLACCLVALVLSTSLLVTPRTVGWLAGGDWSMVLQELPPLLEEEVEKDVVCQPQPVVIAMLGEHETPFRLPHPGDDTWRQAVHGQVAVPPPKV